MIEVVCRRSDGVWDYRYGVSQIVMRLGMQKTTFLERVVMLVVKNQRIENDTEAWHSKTKVFTMILKPGMQKQQYLQ